MDKIALITGAGSGIGQACATGLLRAGWTVVFTGRRVDTLNAAIAAAGDDGKRGVAMAADVGKEEIGRASCRERV